MGNFLIKSIDAKPGGYIEAVKGELKHGDKYFWFDVVKKKITHEGMVFDPEYHKPFAGRYIRDINHQIEKGRIYIKKTK